MKIAATDSVNFERSFYAKFFKKLPNKDIENPKVFNKIGQTLASPHMNRLAVGIAAISTQPWIDLYNPKVDRDTAKASMYRTIAKVIACTSVGFLVRGMSFEIVKKFANESKAKGSTILTPRSILREADPELRESMLKIHRNTYSTVAALAVMVFTNVLLDAPLTTMLANKFIAADKTLNKNRHMEAIA